MRSSRLASSSAGESDCRREAAESISGLYCLRGVLVQRGFGLGYKRAKSGRVVECDIGQDFPVKFNPGFLQPIHKAAVRDVRCAAGRADAHDPQRTEVALLESPPDVAVTERLLNRLLSCTIQLAL